jgi:hypothetical protein
MGEADEDDSGFGLDNDFMMMLLLFSILPKLLGSLFPEKQGPPNYYIYLNSNIDEDTSTPPDTGPPPDADWTDYYTRYEWGHFPGGGSRG